MPLVPELTDVGTLLKSRAPLEIPRYQRGYAWESTEIEDFINDVQKLHDGTENEHFFGTILTVRKHMPGQSRSTVLEIVDGQQRTTTIVLALYAIHTGLVEVARRSEDAGDSAGGSIARESAEDLHRDYLWWKDDMASPPAKHCRLRLSTDDHEFFAALLAGSPTDETRSSHVLLRKAYDAIFGKLVSPTLENSSLSLEDKATDLKKLRNSLVSRAQVLNLSTDSKSMAYRLFTILNDRGRSLSEADLLRTRTLELLDSNQTMLLKADRAWSAIMETGSSSVVAFLRALYSSEKGIRPPSKNFFDALQRHYSLESEKAGAKELSRILKLVQSIAAAYATYRLLNEGQWPFKKAKQNMWTRDRLRRITAVIRNKSSIPLLLAAAQELPEAEFAEVVQALELFLFRYVTVCRGHPSSLGDALFAEAKVIRDKGAAYDVGSLGRVLKKLLKEHAPDTKFEASLADALRYKSSNSGVIRHFLTTLEDFKEAKWSPGKRPQFDTSSTFDFDELDVEHVYPQKAKKIDSALESRKHEVCNLTFWHPDDNRAAQNASFTDKRALYTESKIRMTSRLAAPTKWGEKELNDRQAELNARALKVWSILN